MNEIVRSRDVEVCSMFHATLACGMASIGVVATSLIVDSFALTVISTAAALYAAPMILTGIFVVLAYKLLPSAFLLSASSNFAFHAGILALFSLATIVTGIFLGIVAPLSCLVFGIMYGTILFLLIAFAFLTYIYPPKADRFSSADDILQAVGSLTSLIDRVD